MPSGAVFTGGGGVPGPEDNLNAELYYPAYLFTKGGDGVVRWASRPAITAISGSATYGGTIKLAIGDGRAIASASLTSMGDVTHGQDTDQRRVPLTTTQNGGTVSAALPASVNTLPPGDYELTVVDRNGVPSAAQVLTLRNGAAGSVTVGSATQVQDQGAPAPQPGGTVPLTPDTAVGLEAVNFPGYRVRHQDFGAYLQPAGTGSDAGTKADSTFSVRTGLASADGVSFEAVNFPGYYLTAPVGGGAVGLVKDDGSASFAGRATFAAVTGATGQNTTFQVWADRTLVLRHADFKLFAQKADASDQGRADSTFAVRAGLTAAAPVPLTAGRAVGLQAVNFPGYRVRHQDFAAYLQQVGAGSDAGARADTTFVVRPGLASADGTSLEAVNFPGYYLTAPAGGGALALVKGDGSAAFAARATFAPVAGAAGQGTTFQVWADRTLVLRHAGFRVYAVKTDGSDLSKADSSFTVSSGLSPAPRQ
nr:AbfB domain-containing protein [Quadrisphaera sp. RL12-1S]